MKNSRKSGIMIVKCKKPYIMSVEGQPVEKHVVQCKDITHEAEFIAFDIEQMLKVALFHIPRPEETKSTPDLIEQENKSEKFYETESPSVADVEEQATTIEMIIGMNDQVMISKVMQTFEGFIKCKLICMDGGDPMPYQIWNTLHRDDKLKIMFCYIAFFVNPLQKLAQLSTRMGISSVMQGEPLKTGML
jgi:hypothetical protein